MLFFPLKTRQKFFLRGGEKEGGDGMLTSIRSCPLSQSARARGMDFNKDNAKLDTPPSIGRTSACEIGASANVLTAAISPPSLPP